MRRAFAHYGTRGICLLLLLFCGTVPAAAQSIVWDRLADGFAVALWTPHPSCPDVPPLLAFEIDPTRYRFAVHYYRDESLDVPPDIHEWQRRTGHDLVFNAGLFRENFAYLGLLYGNGRSLGGKRHATWQGLFVAESRTPGGVPARILDLATEDFDEQDLPYREAAQSLMLLDRNGKIRVRQTGKRAQQTIVAEQRSGSILLLKTTSAVTLYDLARCLRDQMPTLQRAMAMDGGSSSDVALAAALQRARKPPPGQPNWTVHLDDETTAHIGLPAVIGISPRQDTPAPSARPSQQR